MTILDCMVREDPDTTRRSVLRTVAGTALGLGGVAAVASASARPRRTISRSELQSRDGVVQLDVASTADCDTFGECTTYTCDYGYDGYPTKLRYIYECCGDGCEIVDSECNCPAYVP